jgi:hypothetical protein
MISIPCEIIIHIFNYIPDKINTSITCKLWRNTLNNLQLSDHNDPYFLKTHYNRKKLIGIKKHMRSITNSNCLNYIFYTLFGAMYFTNRKSIYIPDRITKKLTVPLLLQYCVINKINYCHIKVLMDEMFSYPFSSYNDKHVIEELINTTLNYKSYDILVILALDRTLKSQLFVHIIEHFKYESIDNIFNELDMLINNHIVSPVDFYISVNSLPADFSHKYEIKSFLKKYINSHIVNYISYCK